MISINLTAQRVQRKEIASSIDWLHNNDHYTSLNIPIL